MSKRKSGAVCDMNCFECTYNDCINCQPATRKEQQMREASGIGVRVSKAKA